MRDPVTKSDWHDWKQHRVTRALLHDLNALREQYKEDMAEGHHDEQVKRIQGVCQGLKDVLEYIAHSFTVLEIPEDSQKEETNAD